MSLPTLFVSHGAPTLPLENSPARQFLEGLGRQLPRPRAILVVSGHWLSTPPLASAAPTPDTIHDFYGFPEALYRLRYAPPGAPELAERVAGLLREAGFEAGIDPRRGLDHGAWQPLMLSWPGADIPVLQVSQDARGGAARHLALGRALTPLTGEEVLVVGSGGLTHNLGEWLRHRPGDAEPHWVGEFADWMAARLGEGDEDALADYRRRAPHAARSHPSEDHLLPLHVALGAAGPGWRATALHRSTSNGVLRMDAWRFDAAGSD